MNFKEIVNNKWFKRGGLLLLGLGVTLGVKAAVKKRNERSDFNDDFENSEKNNNQVDYSITDTQETVTNFVSPVIPGMTSYKFLAYNIDSIVIGSKKYSFSPAAIKKIQTYFSKNTKAKAKILASGGIDGKIGSTFISILYGLLNMTSSIGRVVMFNSIIKNSGVTSSEVSVKTISA